MGVFDSFTENLPGFIKTPTKSPLSGGGNTGSIFSSAGAWTEQTLTEILSVEQGFRSWKNGIEWENIQELICFHIFLQILFL